jgi:hypothetical protein
MVDASTSARAAQLRAALALLTFFTIGAAAQPAAHPNLTGTWALDKPHSDNPAHPREQSSSHSGGSGIGRSVIKGINVFGIPVGSLPLPTGHEPEPLDADDLPGAEQALSIVTQIRILQEASATEFDYGGPLTATYEHGRRSEDRDGSVRAGWNGDVFEVVHEYENGTTVTETYLLDGADDLHWLVRLKQKKADPVVVERVYSRETGAANR